MEDHFGAGHALVMEPLNAVFPKDNMTTIVPTIITRFMFMVKILFSCFIVRMVCVKFREAGCQPNVIVNGKPEGNLNRSLKYPKVWLGPGASALGIRSVWHLERI